MAWQDRISKGKYKAPSGEEIEFDFADVRLGVDKKTSVFTFSNVAGAFVQDKGTGATTFPLRIFIAGDIYNLLADKFIAMLSEAGPGLLTHPIYGQRTVVPVKISRRDDLVSAAGQAIFDVPFIETLTELFPRGISDNKSIVNVLISDFDGVVFTDYDDNLVLNTSSETANTKTFIEQSVDSINSTLRPIADLTDTVVREFDDAVSGLKNGIDALINVPADLARQVNRLIRIPINATLSLQASFDGFLSLLNFQQQNISSTIDSFGSNEYYTRRLINYSVMTALVDFTVNQAGYRSRQDAIAAANSLDTEFTSVDTWDATQRATLGIIDTGVIYQPIQEAVARERGRLTSDTFELPLERRFFTDRTRNIVELAVDLYGDADDETINKLIETNNFIGPDLLQIPKGRQVVFFK